MAINPIHADVLDKLDPRFVTYYNENLANRVATHQVPLAEVRANPQAWARPWSRKAGDVENRNIRDWTISSGGGDLDFQVRVYSPDAEKFGDGPFPVHINYHGGGWVFGDLGSESAICERLQERLPIVIVDVDYHLCPEYEFGQNVRDAWAALLWVRENASSLRVDPSSVSVGGISAGAHLACVVQHRARDEGIKLKLLIAAIPPLADHDTYSKPGDSPWPSFSEYSQGAMLSWDRMSYYSRLVFPKDTISQLRTKIPAWWISPLRASEFRGLCDTFIATAECDPLRDEGEGYGRKLVEAGNRVTFRRYLGVPHSFMQLTSILPQAVQYGEDIAQALRSAHGISP